MLTFGLDLACDETWELWPSAGTVNITKSSFGNDETGGGQG